MATPSTTSPGSASMSPSPSPSPSPSASPLTSATASPPPPPPAHKLAYVTLVMNSASYACGALVLAYSLRACGCATEADIVVMVTPDVEAEVAPLARACGLRVCPVEYLEAEARQAQSRRFRHMYTWINKCFTKFRCFALDEYERVVFLDADMLALAGHGKSADALFALRPPAGICATVDPMSAEAQAAQHGQRLTVAEVDKAVRTDYGIRGCVLVLEPQRATLDALCARLDASRGYGDWRYHIGPDERLISEYYLTAPLTPLSWRARPGSAAAGDSGRGGGKESTAWRSPTRMAREARAGGGWTSPGTASGGPGSRELRGAGGFDRGSRGPDLSEWTHVHAKFGFTSWKTAEAPYAPVLLHFVTEKPWSYETYWDDYVVWEETARALGRAYPAVLPFLLANTRLEHVGPKVHGMPIFPPAAPS